MSAILDYLSQNQDRYLEELSSYLRFPSISAQPAHQGDLLACADWLLTHCESIGLKARLVATPGNPVLIARTPARPGPKRPHFLVYGHYDVQPPEPLELWDSPAFEPRVRAGQIYARGSCDNKGQHFAHLKAVEAYFKTGTELPCDITFVVEGEEEVGSSNLAAVLRAEQANLKCDAIIISDTGLVSLKHPTLSYALRGILAAEVKLTGPNRDLHSGIYGGAVDNPAMALCQLLAGLRDKRGRVTIPGFYDDVQPLSARERREMARQPFNEAKFRKFLGVPQLFGEKGFTPIEQRSARPTLEINGLTSGYQGVGSKTIVPSWAKAKITMRLVPNQRPEKIQKLFVSHIKKLCPPTVKLEIEAGHGGEPYLVSPDSPQTQAALRALRTAFGHEPIMIREGGSIPIVTEFKKILKRDVLLLGLSLPDDNPHSPNEKFSLEAFEKGMKMSAALWPELAAVS